MSGYQRFQATTLLRAELEAGVHGRDPAQVEDLFAPATRDRLAAAALCEFWAEHAIALSGNSNDVLAVDLFADAARLVAGEAVAPWLTTRAAA